VIDARNAAPESCAGLHRESGLGLRHVWTVPVGKCEIGSTDLSLAVKSAALALQLPFLKVSESMGNHDSKIVDAGSVD
jgi:hypothetical protein